MQRDFIDHGNLEFPWSVIPKIPEPSFSLRKLGNFSRRLIEDEMRLHGMSPLHLMSDAPAEFDLLHESSNESAVLAEMRMQKLQSDPSALGDFVDLACRGCREDRPHATGTEFAVYAIRAKISVIHTKTPRAALRLRTRLIGARSSFSLPTTPTTR